MNKEIGGKKKYQIIYADPPWFYKDKSKSHGGGLKAITRA